MKPILSNYHIKLGNLALVFALLLIGGQAWGATYSFRANGTAADKAAAAGSNCAACTTDPSTCMGATVYNGETFANGDVIVRCNSIMGGIPLLIFSEIFADISVTLSVPESYVLLETGDKLLLESGDKMVLQ